MKESELQEQMMALVRAFGLHKPGETPCGQPITVAEAYTLAELAREKQLSQHDVVERLNLAKSSVSRLVSKLIERGWIVRERSQEDGRVSLLSLTAAGENLAAELTRSRQAKFSRVLAHIPASELGTVLYAIDLLVQAMRESDGPSN